MHHKTVLLFSYIVCLNIGPKSCMVVESIRAEVQSVYLIGAIGRRNVRDQGLTNLGPQGGLNQPILCWERQPFQASFESGLISGNIALSTHNPPFNQCEIFYCEGKLGGGFIQDLNLARSLGNTKQSCFPLILSALLEDPNRAW